MNTNFSYRIEPVVNEMFQILTHPDLPHKFILVSVHSGKLTNVRKDVLQTVR